MSDTGKCEHLRMIGLRHDRKYCNLTGKELAPWQKCTTNCKDYSGAGPDNTLPKIEDERTMGKRFEWDQPAKNYFHVADGITLREYLKEQIEQGNVDAKAFTRRAGVTETALRQAISRELRSREVIRTPLGINWEVPAVDMVGNMHPVNPHKISLINWCSDCLDEGCYTPEELAKMIGCKPEDLQAALNKYLADAGDEEEPEAENNIPADEQLCERCGRDIEGMTFSDGNLCEKCFEKIPENGKVDGFNIGSIMDLDFDEIVLDALPKFLKITEQEELFKGFLLGYKACSMQ